MSSPKIIHRGAVGVVIALAPALLMGIYVLSILWRVSLAEEDLFGRSYLIHLSKTPHQFTEPPTSDSFGNTTYTYVQKGRTLHVYKQLINGFQHVYGSALASYELGDFLSDLLFRGNEYAESMFCKSSGTEYFFLDTKKDLANNAIGREIGHRARSKQLRGSEAEKFVVNEILIKMNEGTIYNHFQDIRIPALPSLNDSGCPMLAEIQEFRRTDKTLVFH